MANADLKRDILIQRKDSLIMGFHKKLLGETERAF
jgi:hypothetical protein